MTKTAKSLISIEGNVMVNLIKSIHRHFTDMNEDEFQTIMYIIKKFGYRIPYNAPCKETLKYLKQLPPHLYDAELVNAVNTLCSYKFMHRTDSFEIIDLIRYQMDYLERKLEMSKKHKDKKYTKSIEKAIKLKKKFGYGVI
jgi:hypothetical protein